MNKNETNPILYGIDVGTPSDSGGFYGWRLAHKKLSEYNEKQWEDIISQIAEDQRNGLRVCLAIEAPLWGAKKSQVETNLKKVVWTYRFAVNMKSTLYREIWWYTQAGAQTALIAQQFFAELASNCEENPPNQIELYETYISGLHTVTKNITVPKPDELSDFLVSLKKKNNIVRNKDKLDSLESLLLLSKHLKIKNVTTIKSLLKNNGYTIEKWLWNHQSPLTTPLANKDSISFPIGIIGRIPLFSLKTPDYVLLTDRLFTVKKKRIRPTYKERA